MDVTNSKDDRSSPSLASLSLSSSNSSSSKESEPLCEGDTKVVYDILPHPLCDNIFDRVRDEVQWQRMSHQGGEVPRLVAVQGDIVDNTTTTTNNNDNGNNGDGDYTIPIYRHPSDESPPLRPFSPAVLEIKRVVEARVGHPLNHVLIQMYRDGNDYISEHSDKSLDIARDSYIANVSLGAARTMVLRTKRKPKMKGWTNGDSGAEQEKREQSEAAVVTSPSSPSPSPSPIPVSPSPISTSATATATAKDLKRQVQRALLPHNSLFQMGLATNKHWLHGIRQDRRADREKSAEELAFGGGRISLTFRRIATFLISPRGRLPWQGGDGDDSHVDGESEEGDEEGEKGGGGGGNGGEKGETNKLLIWGQGATSKTRSTAQPVTNGSTPSAIAMLKAFGRENQLAAGFDWDEAYGAGFDVLNIKVSPRLFLSGDPVVNMRVQLMLAEFGVGYARGSLASGGGGGGGGQGKGVGKGEEENIKFVGNNDPEKTTVLGGKAIMEYVDRVYGRRNRLATGAAVTSEDDEDADGVLAQQKKESTRFQEALDLLKNYRATVLTPSSPSEPDQKHDLLTHELLKPWTTYAASETQAQEEGPATAGFIAGGSSMTIADFAFWPVLHSIIVSGGTSGDKRVFDADDGNFGRALLRYYERVKARDATKRVLAASSGYALDEAAATVSP